MRTVKKIHHAAPLALLLVLGACSTAPNPEEAALKVSLQKDIAPQSRESRDTIARADILTQGTFWAKEYNKNPGDREAALHMAKVVRTLGNPERAATVATQALALYPDDLELLMVAGRALIESGQSAKAIDYLDQAIAKAPTDWHIYSALGVAYDQEGKIKQARAAYNQALRLSPGNAQVLSNLAMSYAAEGSPERAETLLKKAITRPEATALMRQNLALVLGLQGKFDEARSIAAKDLPANMAKNNIDYVRDMIVRPRRWDSLRNSSDPS